MPNLPDFQTTLISTICYADTGVVIKKSDVLPIMESFVEYDNGVDGVISFLHDGTRSITGNRVKVQVRVRTDGMIYAWGLRADEDTAGTSKDSRNGAANWVRALLPVSGYGVAPGDGDTLLYRALAAIAGAITTTGKITPTAQSVSYYDFQFTSTANIYVFGLDAGSNQSISFQFTQPVGLSLYVLGVRVSDGRTNISNNVTSAISVNSNTLSTQTYFSAGGALGVHWASRQGSAITAVLQPAGTQNSAACFGGVSGTASNKMYGVFVIYASA